MALSFPNLLDLPAEFQEKFSGQLGQAQANECPMASLLFMDRPEADKDDAVAGDGGLEFGLKDADVALPP